VLVSAGVTDQYDAATIDVEGAKGRRNASHLVRILSSRMSCPASSQIIVEE
jgi:hypothetical protein